MNLLEETLARIAESKHSEDDVAWVGSDDGEYAIAWDQFVPIARVTDYDSGYGGNEIPLELVVVFDDGSYLARGEYDGSEWWDYNRTPQPAASKPFDLVKEEHEALSLTFREFKFALAGPTRGSSEASDD